jgi:DNA polymerase III delta prime subunit
MTAKLQKKNKSTLNCDFTHHAYCLVGDRQTIIAELKKELLEKLDFDATGHPDFSLREYDLLKLHPEGKPNYNTILEEIILPAQSFPVKAKNKIIVIMADDIHINAQNSLLKFFEEPTASTKIFLILPSASRLLPTVLSRLVVMDINREDNIFKEGISLFNEEEFLAGSIADRMKTVSEILSARTDEEISRGDISEFLRRLLKLCFEKVKDKKQTKENLSWLGELEKNCRYSEDPSSSFKIILEYIAIILPRLA